MDSHQKSRAQMRVKQKGDAWRPRMGTEVLSQLKAVKGYRANRGQQGFRGKRSISPPKGAWLQPMNYYVFCSSTQSWGKHCTAIHPIRKTVPVPKRLGRQKQRGGETDATHKQSGQGDSNHSSGKQNSLNTGREL